MPTLTINYKPLDWFTNRLVVGGDFPAADRYQYYPKNDQDLYRGDANNGRPGGGAGQLTAYHPRLPGHHLRRPAGTNASSDLTLGVQVIDEVLRPAAPATGTGLSPTRTG